jgi:excisionase family DNA binding protein
MAAKPRSNIEHASIGEKLLTICESAEILRIHPQTVREYIRRGELQGPLIGRRWRLHRRLVRKFTFAARPNCACLDVRQSQCLEAIAMAANQRSVCAPVYGEPLIVASRDSRRDVSAEPA